jgi:hypothetical protein
MSSAGNGLFLYWLGKIRLTLLLALFVGGACAERAPADGPAVPGAGAPSSSGSSGAGAFPASSGGSGAMNAAGRANQGGGGSAAAGSGGFGAAGASSTGGRPGGSSGGTSTGGSGANAGSGGSGGVAGTISGGGAGESGGEANGVAGTGGAAAGSAGVGGAGTRWVGTWGAAPQLTETENLPPAPGLSNNSLRQIFYVSIGGSRLRLQLSNQYGNAPLVISGVHLARSMSGHTIDAATDRALAFSGSLRRVRVHAAGPDEGRADDRVRRDTE